MNERDADLDRSDELDDTFRPVVESNEHMTRDIINELTQHLSRIERTLLLLLLHRDQRLEVNVDWLVIMVLVLTHLFATILMVIRM